MRTKFLAAALIASSALAAPAFAQDQDSGFTGPRAEAIVGWDRVEDDSTGGHRDGVVYGGQIGYDIQKGGTVFGLEAEATGATTRETQNDVLVAGDRLRVNAGRDFYVGGRLGFTVGDRALVYAKGGYTNAFINSHYRSGTTASDDGNNIEGWRAGAGAEYKLNDKVFVKAEYRYSKYDTEIRPVDVTRHQVVGGVGIRF